MNRRQFLKAMTGSMAFGLAACAVTRSGLEPTACKLPRWRGFNLLEKFHLSRQNMPFVEQDFEWLAGWGFDFVRLPMDYRFWAPTPEAEFHEPTLREIDQAVAWGRQYGVHVNLNFHRGPGYCVAMRDGERPTLWTDPAVQEQFARHWGVFAKRYRGIPSRQLSFNLINEPPAIAGEQYVAALNPAIAAIRAADPDRLIIADGLQFGNKPVSELIPLGVAQSTRGYTPHMLSHYRASWVNGSDKYPLPVWPVPMGITQYLYGDNKPELKSPLVLKVNCLQETPFAIRVERVAGNAELVVQADEAVVFQNYFQPGTDTGKSDINLDFTATIPAGTREIRIGLARGDWLRFTEIRIGPAVIQPTVFVWGKQQETYVLEGDNVRPVELHYLYSRETLQKEMIEPWQKLEAQGVGVHVGEWGAYNQTPHPVALAWMRDCLANWKAAGWGWALWNFRGSFGILDSDRSDVQYEDFKGHRLDRQMLELLRAY